MKYLAFYKMGACLVYFYSSSIYIDEFITMLMWIGWSLRLYFNSCWKSTMLWQYDTILVGPSDRCGVELLWSYEWLNIIIVKRSGNDSSVICSENVVNLSDFTFASLLHWMRVRSQKRPSKFDFLCFIIGWKFEKKNL